MSVHELMKIFYFNRLAARVFTKDPDGWLIKGGQALLVRYRGAARLSQDIDLQCTEPDRSAEDARQLVIAAASYDLGDYLRYAPSRFEEHSDEGRGGAQHFQVFLGPQQVDTIKVDLVVGRTLAGTPETRTLKSAVDLEWPVDWPLVHLYPVIDHITDKICAMYERHGLVGQHGSNRYRDLADLLLISQQETVPGPAVHQALHRETDRRRTDGINVLLPPAFQAPGPDWHDGYPQQAQLVIGLRGCRSFPEAAQAAGAFLNPLLDGTVNGMWNPHQAAWN
ncbi:nucleotidyl transferase AbiEii/AbiGii toxin family protein [Streptomyces olivaceus]|uniref:Nucleotidyl transferase AbiEii/AbiGii toxin family protein n=1 Tax=Streptomyces olivaceus TaxID=47716 RepID=A0ABS7WEZ6_STROV|nr:nucleotidyl transferase AbiEii/AbiGii toxin family protein [Streptomyces olivaceus]MBZ6093712.1 nucleotidyl transferase AbiEii/AbiGii toxin family protein [Streptomyces olivaceus]MBZ6100777.1 nucleotidyl transferase AbiEii/AbiGii toxin family protein [Streptomyces olivaceus]MBZ6121886.1 nucleotidyl transferase AbiEii/AbiGii toxin family protein [Streptomyces olivaceus]MBZ6156549.1 nucleotidyl transferase AbiEii/AbiGii toxin family protein [Streptomyces olivaceus]MBZ6303141.1 nucleotidyl tra